MMVGLVFLCFWSSGRNALRIVCLDRQGCVADASYIRPRRSCLIVRRLIRNLEGRAVLRPALAAVVEASGRDVRMAEPFLHLGNVSLVFERVRGGGCTQAMHAESVDGNLRLLRIGEYAFVDAVGRY